MCTPLEAMVQLIVEGAMANFQLRVIPVHRGQPGDPEYRTRYLLIGMNDQGGTPLGEVNAPFDTDEFIHSLHDQGYRLAGGQKLPGIDREQTGVIERKNRIEDNFPNDPGHPSKRNGAKDAPYTPEQEVPQDIAEWLRKTFHEDAN